MGLNPVERRLLHLRERWEAFSRDGDKRLLVWKIPDEARRLVECFFESQKYESEYSSPDLFIVFNVPFEHSMQFSRALKHALAGQYEASREDLAQEGINVDWRLDPSLPDTAGGFLEALRTFGSIHQKSIGHLVAAFMPAAVASDEGYCGWLTGCLEPNMPARMRIVAIDLEQAPRLRSLESPKVAMDSPQIDALAMAQETFAQEGATGPAAVFRNHLVGLVSLIARGAMGDIRAKAIDAFNFARAQGWADQEVVVRMLFAGAQLKHQQFADAIRTYGGARESAQLASEAGHPTGRQLVLQTWFGQAGAHLAAGEVQEASDCYEQAANLAGALPNVILAVEACRMAMFCQARLQRREQAIGHGQSALVFAEMIKPEARAMTTLPIAVVDLLRVIQPERVRELVEVNTRLLDALELSRARLEHQVGSDAPAKLADAEQEHEGAVADAHREAAARLIAVEARGSEEFCAHFARARQLLAAHWPQAILQALPPESLASATAEGTPA